MAEIRPKILVRDVVSSMSEIEAQLVEIYPWERVPLDTQKASTFHVAHIHAAPETQSTPCETNDRAQKRWVNRIICSTSISKHERNWCRLNVLITPEVWVPFSALHLFFEFRYQFISMLCLNRKPYQNFGIKAINMMCDISCQRLCLCIIVLDSLELSRMCRYVRTAYASNWFGIDVDLHSQPYHHSLETMNDDGDEFLFTVHHTNANDGSIDCCVNPLRCSRRRLILLWHIQRAQSSDDGSSVPSMCGRHNVHRTSLSSQSTTMACDSALHVC